MEHPDCRRHLTSSIETRLVIAPASRGTLTRRAHPQISTRSRPKYYPGEIGWPHAEQELRIRGIVQSALDLAVIEKKAAQPARKRA
ncbi:hypothetical protein [Bradyrhizobium pachyrhizi]|uniref:hypothetical protein n=1 Tax=Bradyrhizobium pachyrhizi TaxID=280333 RepID=UPI001FCD6EED|nr:hypothetical protein [Bradyrhizobium pachyrhizi]